MGQPIQPGDLQFITREYYLAGGDEYSNDAILTFQQLDTTLIFLSNSIANVNPVVNINTGSLLLTASANSNIITFSKADGTPFTVTVDTGSGQTYTAGDGININGSNVVSAKLGLGLEFDGSNQIQSQVRTVNLQTPINGNIPLSITNTITGPSSSLSGSPFFLPDTYSPRPPVSGTIFVVSGDDDANKNGNAYIFVTSSTQPGSWQQIFGFNETTADLRYVRLFSTTSQDITSSLTITGSSVTFSSSLYWPITESMTGGGAVNTLVWDPVFKQIKTTGSYGIGGGSTPAALAFGTQTANYALVAGDNNRLVRMSSSNNLEVYVTASNFSSGDQVIVFQSGSGQVTFIPSSTTEILSANNMRKLRTQYSAATLTFTGNTCYLFGDIAP
jgi:hypothetical protein